MSPARAPDPSRRSARVRAALSAGAAAGIFALCLACITRTGAPPPVATFAAEPPPMVSYPPAVRRANGPWSRRRLGYTALTFEMPDVPEVLAVEDGERSEVARVSRDDGAVRYEVRSFEHHSDVLNNVDQLVAAALTEIAARVGGVRRTQATLTQGGYPGADLTFDFPRTGATIHVRMLVGRTRYYAAYAAFPTRADAVLRDDVARFHASLAFDEGDQPEADGDGVMGAPQFVQPVGAWFAVRMPGRPRREARDVRLPEGPRPRVTYTVSAPSGDERFVVAVTAFERRPPAGVFAAALAGATGPGLTLRGERPITTQGFAGRAYTLEHADGRRVTELRMFVTRARLYEVSATRPAAPDAAAAERVSAFFDTLRIL